jgi:hypothetical protein
VSFPGYVRVFRRRQRHRFVAERTEERLTPSRRLFTVMRGGSPVFEAEGPGAGGALEGEEVLKFAGRECTVSPEVGKLHITEELIEGTARQG